MAEEKKEEKKLIIDEDWKIQAQKEKEILAAKEAEEKKQKINRGWVAWPVGAVREPPSWMAVVAD